MRFAEPWEGTIYRATAIPYATCRDLLKGVGAQRSGGRWNPPGFSSVVYASLTPETALAEALVGVRELDVPVAEAMPLVIVAVTIAAHAILDLTSPNTQSVLDVSVRRMVSTPWSTLQDEGAEALTQALGRIAWEERLEGLIVPSARQRGGANIVLFRGRRRSGSSWRIQHARQLPRARDE